MSIWGNAITLGSSGGGGGPSASDAILTVTVPTGSTVTAVKGGVTLTPTMWVQAADATLDCALFVIAPAQFDSVNPWTVTATDGTTTLVDTVIINSNKQFSIGFVTKYFIHNGILVDPTLVIFGNVTASQVGDVYAVKTISNNTGGLKAVSVDLTSFTSLIIDVATGSRSWKGTGVPAIGYGTNIRLSADDVAGFSDLLYLESTTGEITAGQYKFDVSTVSGIYEIACSVGGTQSFSSRYGYLNIENLFLR